MNATVEHLESVIENLIKDRDELQEKITAMCKAIPGYDWGGDSEKKIADLAKERDALAASRYAYATEFSPDEEGHPDVGSIHQNIRALKAAAKLAMDALYEAQTADDGIAKWDRNKSAITALNQAGVQ